MGLLLEKVDNCMNFPSSLIPQFEKIPERYHRTFEGKPFDTCDFCRESLLDADKYYLIYKIFEGHNLLQKIVLCNTCIADLQKGMSEESKLAMQGWLDRERMVLWRDPIILGDEPDKSVILTGRCAACEKPRSELERHVEYVLCAEDRLYLRTVHPFSVCEECIIQLDNLLSKKTKEHEDDFIRRFLGLPPDFNSIQPRETVERYNTLKKWMI